MTFIRIDDVSNNTINIVNKLVKLFSNNNNICFLLNVIISDISFWKLESLIKNHNVILLFHGFLHTRDEFLLSFNYQEKSFIDAELFFKYFWIKNKYFSPPYNIMDKNTLFLFKQYGYSWISIDYKSVKKYWLINKQIRIYETNYFFNKKENNWLWYIDSEENIFKQIKNLKNRNITIWVEIHPQHVSTQEDINKYIYLLNCLKND